MRPLYCRRLRIRVLDHSRGLPLTGRRRDKRNDAALMDASTKRQRFHDGHQDGVRCGSGIPPSPPTVVLLASECASAILTLNGLCVPETPNLEDTA